MSREIQQFLKMTFVLVGMYLVLSRFGGATSILGALGDFYVKAVRALQAR